MYNNTLFQWLGKNFSLKLGATFLLLLLGTQSYGQIPLPPEKDCTSKDLKVVNARLDLKPCFQCEIGEEPIPVALILAIDNTTSSFRPTFFFTGILEETDAEGNVTSSPITGCNDVTGLPKNVETELEFLDILYTCGSTYVLKDLYLAWTDASKVEDQTSKNSCTNLRTKTTSKGFLDIAPKCGTVPVLQIDTPLIVTPTFTDSVCNDDNGPSNDGTATATALGGKPPYTYVWDDPNAQTTPTAIGLSAGTYKCIVTDSDNCIFEVEAIISDPGEFSASATPTDVSCNDDDGSANDGSILLTVINGVAAEDFTYSWVGPNNYTSADKDISNLAPGLYTCTITDDGDCVATTFATILDAVAFTASGSGTAVTCASDGVQANDGTATITITNGGVGTIDYLWSNGETTSTITGLSAGLYTVTATDDDGCTATASYTVAPAVDFTASGSGTAVTCASDGVQANDGTATITITNGGVGTIDYLWSNGETTSTITGLSAGLYTVTATDDDGCTATASYTVAPAVDFTASGSGTAVTCASDGVQANDGTATITITNGGVGTIDYLWSNGETTSTITGLSAGLYTVTATDENDCTATASYTVAPAVDFTASGSGTAVTCASDGVQANDGTATITITNGGVGIIDYLWSNGETTSTITGLSAGLYTVTATDDDGCTATASYTVAPAVDFTASGSGTAVTCASDGVQANDGTATITITNGGVGTIDYLWSNGETTSTITGLSAGLYTVTATDDDGCTATASYTVAPAVDFTASGSGTAVTCASDGVQANDGTATITITNGGVGTIDYLWSNGETTSTITGLSAGLYTVTATDENDCTATASYTVAPAVDFTASGSGTAVTCASDGVQANDGTASITITNGGEGTIDYLWSNGEITPSITGLSAGLYTVTATDEAGCTATASYTVDPAVAFTASGDGTPVTCASDGVQANDGTASITITNGGEGTIDYLWSNGEITPSITGLSAGLYTVTATDEAGCTATASYTVDPAVAFTASGDGTPVTCASDGVQANDGTASITITNGGEGTIDYLWSNGEITPSITGLSAGLYTVTATDEAGCTATASYTVDPAVAFTASGDGTPVTCASDGVQANDGTASITITNGGEGTIDYLWSNGEITSTITGLSAGLYTVTATDEAGCTATASYTVDPAVAFTASGDGTPVTCASDGVQANDGTASITITNGGEGTIDYLWSNGEITPSITGLSAGLYTVTATDEAGCTATASYTVDPAVAITASATGTAESCAGEDGSINATITNGVGNLTYSWTTSDGSIPADQEDDEDLSGLIAGTYDLVVTDDNDCTATTSYTVDPPEGCNHLFPTQTACSDYLYCEKDKFVQEYMCVTIKKVKGIDQVTNVIPGALFYYGDFSVALNKVNTTMIVEMQQEAPDGFKFMRYVNNSNVRIYQNGCQVATITKVSTRVENGKYYVKAEFKPQVAGVHVFSVKLDPKTVIGSTGFIRDDANFQTNSYLMGMIVDGNALGVSFGSLGMNTNRRCSDPAIFDRGTCDFPSNSTTSALSSESLKSSSLIEEQGFSVAPVPFKDQVSLKYEFDYTSDVKIQFFDLNGSLLRTYADKQVTNGDETQINIDFALRANQVYIIRVETDRDSFSKNVMSGN